MHGALLIHKEVGISSFGVIESLERLWAEQFGVRRKDSPKMGHGGTLDPFATGLLIVLVGKGVKLSRYFLDSVKGYEGVIRFGETTIPGDPTGPISEKSDQLPRSLEEIQEFAHRFTQEPYLQIPPMHSAKKRNGKPLYELARKGIEVERAPKQCHLSSFNISSFDSPRAEFQVECSSGTYVRTLAQDLARKMGTVALLETLHRVRCGAFNIEKAQTLGQIAQATQVNQNWEQLSCWIPFDQLLRHYPQIEATQEERSDLFNGKQAILQQILERRPSDVASDHLYMIYHANSLVAVLRKDRQEEAWNLERVFLPSN